MIKTKAFEKGIKKLITRARKVNPGIGTYMEHYINHTSNYTAVLSNGEVDIPFDIAYAYETKPETVTLDSIEKVANSYRRA